MRWRNGKVCLQQSSLGAQWSHSQRGGQCHDPVPDLINSRASQIAAEIALSSTDASVPNVLVHGAVDAAAAALFFELHRLLAIEIPDGDEAAARERGRAVCVLNAVNEFVGRAWCEPRQLAAQSYFLKLALAVEQLNNGTRHPLFEPQKRGRGRTADPIEQWRVRSQVCVAFHCLERDGRDMRQHSQGLEKIAAEIAKAMPSVKRAMRTPKGTTSASAGRTEKQERVAAILSWRRTFTQGQAPQVAQENWRYGRDLVDELADRNPQEYAKLARVTLANADEGARALTI